jgi:hypothetical protein
MDVVFSPPTNALGFVQEILPCRAQLPHTVDR